MESKKKKENHSSLKTIKRVVIGEDSNFRAGGGRGGAGDDSGRSCADVLSGEKLRGAAEGHGVSAGSSEDGCTGLHIKIIVVIGCIFKYTSSYQEYIKGRQRNFIYFVLLIESGEAT